MKELLSLQYMEGKGGPKEIPVHSKPTVCLSLRDVSSTYEADCPTTRMGLILRFEDINSTGLGEGQRPKIPPFLTAHSRVQLGSPEESTRKRGRKMSY